MCSDNSCGKTPQPVVQRDVLKLICCKHLQKHQIGIAGIFYVMSGDGWNESHIVGVVVHRARVSYRHKHSHPGLARDIELPFRGIRMPVQLSHPSRLDGNQSGGEMLRYREVMRINYTNFAPLGFFGGSHRLQLEGVLVRGFDLRSTYLRLIMCQRAGNISWKDEKSIRWQLCKSTLIHFEILCQNLGWGLGDPLRE